MSYIPFTPSNYSPLPRTEGTSFNTSEYGSGMSTWTSVFDVSDNHIDSRTCIVTRCYYLRDYQWTQTTWGMLDGTDIETINYSFKDYPHNSYKIIINNYNYASIRACDQKSFNDGIDLLEDYIRRNKINIVYAHRSVVCELKQYLSAEILEQVEFRTTVVLSDGVSINSDCVRSKNHNSINCSLCIYHMIRKELVRSINPSKKE